jgi:hypothetical protein
MRYLKLFEDFENVQDDKKVLFIIDVQESFRSFFNELYLSELKKYCEEFDEVYQIFDNHVHGSDVDKDYLYDDEPDSPISDDVYTFPKQVKLIEKRYNYDVDVDFYKKILNRETYDLMKEKEKNNEFKRGDLFYTKKDTVLVYIGNNHRWYHCPKLLHNIFKRFKDKEIKMVGGSDQECFLDVEVAALALGVKVIRDARFIWSASNCPTKFTV